MTQKAKPNLQNQAVIKQAREEISKAIGSAIRDIKHDFEIIRKDNNKFKSDCENTVGKVTRTVEDFDQFIPERINQAYQNKIRPTNGAIGNLKRVASDHYKGCLSKITATKSRLTTLESWRADFVAKFKDLEVESDSLSDRLYELGLFFRKWMVLLSLTQVLFLVAIILLGLTS